LECSESFTAFFWELADYGEALYSIEGTRADLCGEGILIQVNGDGFLRPAKINFSGSCNLSVSNVCF